MLTRFKEDRELLKSRYTKDMNSDKKMGLPEPPIFKEYNDSDMIITLPTPNPNMLKEKDFHKIIEERRSFRDFTDYIMRIEELSYLLWATQGIIKEDKGKLFRPVPSTGKTNPFETYIIVKRVEGIRAGVYRYLPENHEILLVKADEDIHERLNNVVIDQEFVLNASVSFVWAAVPYRTEWDYDIEAYKIILIELGHIAQNLYLISEGLNLGMSTIIAYNQEGMDKLIEVDGGNEISVYLAVVGMKEKNK